MSIKEYMGVISKVLLDWHVIVTVILMIMVMYFANMIMHYKKKPRVPKPKKTVEEKPAEKSAEASEEKSE